MLNVQGWCGLFLLVIRHCLIVVLTHQSLFCIPSWSSKAAVDLCPIYFPECFKWTLSFDHWRHLLIWFYCTMTDNIHIYTHICSRYTKYKCVRGRSSVHRLSKIGSISDLVYAGVKFKCRVVLSIVANHGQYNVYDPLQSATTHARPWLETVGHHLNIDIMRKYTG